MLKITITKVIFFFPDVSFFYSARYPKTMVTFSRILKYVFNYVYSFFSKSTVLYLCNSIYKEFSFVQLTVTIAVAVVPSCSFKIGVVKNLAKFTGKHLCRSLFFKLRCRLLAFNFIEKRLQHRYFPLKF